MINDERSLSFIHNFFIVVFFLGLIGSPLLKILGISITGFDYLIVIIFILFLFYKNIRSFYISKIHFLLILSLLAIIVLNFRSKFVTTKWGLVGAFLIILPHFIFILCRNIRFSTNQIYKVLTKLLLGIDLILIVTIIETLFFKNGKGTYSIFILKTPAFAVTLANLSIILRLYFVNKFKKKKQENYLKILLTCFFVIFSIQFKSILSLLFIMFIFFGDNFKRQLTLIFALTLGLRLLLFIPLIEEKVEKYLTIYTIKDSTETSGVPRIALYLTSFVIANDFFPLGTGPGTFGSYPVNINYSDVYYEYGLNFIHGIGPESTARGSNTDKFLLDTYWSSVLGELGVFGFILVLVLYFYPLLLVLKKNKKGTRLFDSADVKIISAIVLFLGFESIVLSLLTQSSFMLIMSGFTAMIIQKNEYD